MKTNRILSKVVGMAAMASLAIAFSCQEDENPYATEASNAAEESVTDYYYEDADDMAGVTVAAEDGTAGGKVSSEAGMLSVDDDRFCANVTISFLPDVGSPDLNPMGDIVIDFKDGCEDPRGNVRSGKIIIHFEGRRFLPGSTLSITFENYVINGITLNGTRVLTNIAESTEDSPKFRVYLNGSVEWPDSTTATREHCYEREWIRALSPLNDEWHVNQCANTDVWPHDFAATGVNRRGVEYEIVIVTELVYKRGCPIAVSGVKQFTNVETGQVVIVDYGDGECDRAITITIEGTTRSVNVNNRG
jgi:hypothetical protein